MPRTEPLCPDRADAHRPDRRRAVVSDETDAHVGIADARVLGAAGDLAEKRDRRRQPDAVAVHRADDGNFAVDEVLQILGAPRGSIGSPSANTSSPGAPRHALHVAADAEILPGAGEQDRAHLALVGRIAPEVLQLVVKVAVGAVAVFGPVERDGGETVVFSILRQR